MRRSELFRTVPYLVHTNRELGLMLRGVKPMAVFGWVEGYEVDFVMRYLRMFDRHVSERRFRKHKRSYPAPGLPHLSVFTVFYTLPSEEWRVGEYEALLSLRGKWTPSRERRLGELLGYEDWQNDFHLKIFKEID
jgi:hypothetical protein